MRDDSGDKRTTARCPKNIAVIGGGRWARVLTEVLCSVVPSATSISVHSRHNAASMSSWISEKGIGDRVRVSAQWPRLRPAGSNAVIVANAARDHEAAVGPVLSAGLPVLVEKPIAPTAATSLRLAELARSRNVRFAAAHVFLFARYIENFKTLVKQAGSPRWLRIHWVDPRNESRYGEKKRYDPGLPVFADCLPHVLSIAGALTAGAAQSCRELEIFRGGAQVELELLLGDIPCKVRLVRNGSRRERLVEVAAGQEVLQLDFSIEPGVIRCGSSVVDADPEWAVQRRPVACMLTAFLDWADGGEFDSRLYIGVGVQATQVIEQAAEMYRSALMPWVISELAANPEGFDEDLGYALGEILQSNGSLERPVVEQQMERVRRHFAGTNGQQRSMALAESRDPSAILRSIAAAQ